MNKKTNIRVIVINEDTGDELVNQVSESCTYNMNNDLGQIPPKTGSFHPGQMWSRGWSIDLSAYFVNPNAAKDYAEAVEETFK